MKSRRADLRVLELRRRVQDPRPARFHRHGHLSILIDLDIRTSDNLLQGGTSLEPSLGQRQSILLAVRAEVREDGNRLRAVVALAHGEGALVFVDGVVLKPLEST